MNRKERRAAQKQGRDAPTPAQNLSPGTVGANLFASAVQHYRAGQMPEAERACRDALALDPNHFDSLHLLGMIAYQFGAHDAAADLLRRALAVNGRNADCHFNIAQVLRALGRVDEAAAHFTETTALKRDYIAAHLALGDLFVQQDKLTEAHARYQQTLVLDPRSLPVLTSECRDLLFHAQEHQLTIPAIKAFLTDNDLAFIGFGGEAMQHYRARFPDDKAMTDLDRWHLVETENPKMFVGLYQFWVQKPRPAAASRR